MVTAVEAVPSKDGKMSEEQFTVSLRSALMKKVTPVDNPNDKFWQPAKIHHSEHQPGHLRVCRMLHTQEMKEDRGYLPHLW